MRARIPGKDTVEVWYSGARKVAYYKNLMRCGSIWVCPLCASAITEKRLDELTRILTAFEEIPILMGGEVEYVLKAPRWHLGLATFTIGHKRGDPLENVLRTLEKAYKRMWGGRWAMAWRERRVIVGTIRAIEITYGDNGWHPHIHTLMVRRSANTPRDVIDMELDLQFRWNDCVSLAGGVVDPIHGVDYRAATESAVAYISKLGVNVLGDTARWSAISEIVKYPVKRGRKGSMTTWDMLGQYAAGDVKAGELWIEAMKNLRGRRHVVPSAGLLETLHAYQNMQCDDDLSRETETAGDVLLASLTVADWRTITRKGLIGEVVTVAAEGDHKLLFDYLESVL
jgi:hypothetical protein